MKIKEEQLLERRILALGPHGKDAQLIQSVLGEAGMTCCFLSTSSELARELNAGAGALIVTEEAVHGGAQGMLAEFVRSQPTWSELPILILTTRDSSSPVVVQFMELLGNVTLIERPMRIAVLVSSLRAALRARHRQYQIRTHIIERNRIEESLRETDRRKDEFLAALAHELRNPLAPISNTLHLLRGRGEEDPEATMAHDVIRRQVQHLTRLVDDLLDVSRITRGKVSLRREIVGLDTVVRNAVETSRPLIEGAQPPSGSDHAARAGAGARGSRTPCPGSLQSAQQRSQVHPERRPHPAEVSCEAGSAVIRVRDNGIGIAEEALPRVFELFMQEADGAGRAQGGLGIGLTLVRTFVSLHGGVVEAFSGGHGRGSEFVIRLPALMAKESLPDAAEHGATVRLGAGHRILVVDDNEDGAQSLAMLLEMLGNEVHTVYDGPAGGGGHQPVSSGRGAARHRPADAERLRDGAALAIASRSARCADHRAHRLGPGRRPPPLA